MQDFVAIDFETANGRRSSVCAVGIVVVRGGEIVDKYYSLISLHRTIIHTGQQRCMGLRVRIQMTSRSFLKCGHK